MNSPRAGAVRLGTVDLDPFRPLFNESRFDHLISSSFIYE